MCTASCTLSCPPPYLGAPLLPCSNVICVVESQAVPRGLSSRFVCYLVLLQHRSKGTVLNMSCNPFYLPQIPSLIPKFSLLFQNLIATAMTGCFLIFCSPPAHCFRILKRETCRDSVGDTRVLFSLEGQEGMWTLMSAIFDTAVTGSSIHTLCPRHSTICVLWSWTSLYPFCVLFRS